MKQAITHSALIAALLGLALAGCQKKEEPPMPEMPGSEAPAPEAMPAEPAPMAEPAPGMAPAPMESAPRDTPSAPPAQ